ncbi:MAG: magnesium chelatase [Syntrophomonadaceae bacterium]|nr:magnesium chelatase [Syntrophomonadaceae bacterium]
MITFSRLERYEGNEVLFELVLMSAISSLVGEPLHIHAEGLRGTGKTTIMRAIQDVLPPITRIKGCIYNCDPHAPHCPRHRDLSTEEVAALGTEEIRMPFLEISHSARVGTVAGSIDLSSLTDVTKPEAQLLPGLIPQAHRGIIFIDEINRLADTSPEITDILLDVMGNKPGHLQIEEAGLPTVDLPVSVSVWAASNPDEDPGALEEIRRQLSDRFDMVCYMGRPDNVDAIAKMLRENSHSYKIDKKVDDKSAAREEAAQEQNEKYRADIIRWAGVYAKAELPDFLRNYIARLYIKYNLESIRAIEAMQQGALLYSVLRNRDQAMLADVTHIIPQVLRHRVGSDVLLKLTNDSDLRGTREGVLNSRSRKRSDDRDKKIDENYFSSNARSMKGMGRNELVQTEKKLNPDAE